MSLLIGAAVVAAYALAPPRESCASPLRLSHEVEIYQNPSPINRIGTARGPVELTAMGFLVEQQGKSYCEVRRRGAVAELCGVRSAFWVAVRLGGRVGYVHEPCLREPAGLAGSVG